MRDRLLAAIDLVAAKVPDLAAQALAIKSTRELRDLSRRTAQLIASAYDHGIALDGEDAKVLVGCLLYEESEKASDKFTERIQVRVAPATYSDIQRVADEKGIRFADEVRFRLDPQ